MANEIVICTIYDGIVDWLRHKGYEGFVVNNPQPRDIINNVVLGSVPLELAALARIYGEVSTRLIKPYTIVEKIGQRMVEKEVAGHREYVLNFYEVGSRKHGDLKIVDNQLFVFSTEPTNDPIFAPMVITPGWVSIGCGDTDVYDETYLGRTVGTVDDFELRKLMFDFNHRQIKLKKEINNG